MDEQGMEQFPGRAGEVFGEERAKVGPGMEMLVPDGLIGPDLGAPAFFQDVSVAVVAGFPSMSTTGVAG